MERKRSYIWLHFNNKEDGKAECCYCKTILSTKEGASGNLQRHLKKKHITVDVPSSLPYQHLDQRSGTSRFHSSLVSTGVTVSECIASSSTSAPAQIVSPQPTISSSLAPPSSQVQAPISKFVDIVRPISLNKVKNINDQLLNIIIKEYYLFSIVEDKEFKNFVHLLCPNYSPPSRKTLISSTMPMMYREVVDTVKNRLNNSVAVAFTTDTWTSCNNENFIAVTAHFLNDQSVLNSLLLSCEQSSVSHSTVNLSLIHI